jgi:3'(2'), 5'-bisphosphate nucleotidase
MTDSIIRDDAELAARLAEVAGRIAVEVRDSGLIEGKPLGSAGDNTANAFLMRAIAAQRPDDGVLSEESRDTM